MLPAGHGDSILIEYGTAAAAHRVLIDGGPASSYDRITGRIKQLPRQERCFELLVMTHVDADHIEGVLGLLNDRALGATFNDIWFNGYRHLPKDELGAAQGEMLSAVIETRELAWNVSFGGGPVQAGPAASASWYTTGRAGCPAIRQPRSCADWPTRNASRSRGSRPTTSGRVSPDSARQRFTSGRLYCSMRSRLVFTQRPSAALT